MPKQTTGIPDKIFLLTSQITRAPTGPESHKLPYRLGHRLLKTCQLHSNSLKERGSRELHHHHSSQRGNCSQVHTPQSKQRLRIPAQNPSLNYKPDPLLWQDNWWTLQLNTFMPANSLKHNAKLTHLIIPLYRE